MVDALYTAFDSRKHSEGMAEPRDAPPQERSSRDSGPPTLTQSTLLTAIRSTVPLATTMSEQITTLRTWAQHRARSASSTPASTSTTNRRIA